jgi:hypothetical protein
LVQIENVCVLRLIKSICFSFLISFQTSFKAFFQLSQQWPKIQKRLVQCCL